MKQLSAPLLSRSMLSVRLNLARQRLKQYPLHTLDFVMMDLERPTGVRRHADQCVGDLTGRLLEFWSAAEGVDGVREERLPELFERILRTRQKSGLFGAFNGQPENPQPVDGNLSVVMYRLFSGFMRYWQASGDSRALEAAVDQAEWLLAHRDRWQHHFPEGARAIEFWVTEPLAMLYHATGDDRYLDFIAWINRIIGPCEYTHSHGFMATMRGLQLAALYSGDETFNRKPEEARRRIIDGHYQMIDGCVSENHPRSFRNEGCSIADWLMMNLNAGLLGAPDGYAEAENILWNALFFNQFATGGFGHRDLMENGYAMGALSEAWWCCTHHAGLAMTEVARHAVTCSDGVIRVNLLIPGRFRVAGGEVEISTVYPQRGRALIRTRDCSLPVEVTPPPSLHEVELRKLQQEDGETILLSGRLGYWLDRREEPRVALRYGPLLLAPLTYYWGGPRQEVADDIPAGYVPDFLPAGTPRLLVGEPDRDGLLPPLRTTPLPEWSYFETGAAAELGFDGISGYVDCLFPGGEKHELWFSPLCHLTSNLSFYDTPLLFEA